MVRIYVGRSVYLLTFCFDEVLMATSPLLQDFIVLQAHDSGCSWFDDFCVFVMCWKSGVDGGGVWKEGDGTGEQARSGIVKLILYSLNDVCSR